jgi:hypothetical protein
METIEMDEKKERNAASLFKRIRHLRTNNPFCRICGKALLWAKYQSHHVDLKANSPDQLFICEDCHTEIHAMLRDFPRIPSDVPKSRHRLIHMARGQIAIAKLSQKKWEDVAEWLLNTIDLPADVANDNEDVKDQEEDFERPDIIADLEARFGENNDGGVK